MRVYIDGFVYCYQRFGGINRYIEEQSVRFPDDIETLVSVPGNITLLKQFSDRVRRIDVNYGRFRPRRLSSLIERCRQQFAVDSWKADIVHPSWYKSLLLPLRAKRSQVLIVTVYDFINRLFPEYFNIHSHLKAQESLIQMADAIICISENTRRDLNRFYPKLSTPTFVVPPSASEDFSPAESGWNSNDIPEFLIVGGRFGYKNFKTAINALALLNKKKKEWILSVVGTPVTDQESALVCAMGLEKQVHFIGYLDNVDLSAAYRRCCALIYPSLYEGFGIPPLEAIRCGTVVVACRCSSIPEVVGDAAVLVEPGDVHMLAEALESVMDDMQLRSSLLEKCKGQAALFSWDRSAALTLEVYKSVL